MTVTKTIIGMFIANPHFRQPYAENLNQAYDELNFVKVMGKIAAEVDQRRPASGELSGIAAPQIHGSLASFDIGPSNEATGFLPLRHLNDLIVSDLGLSQNPMERR